MYKRQEVKLEKLPYEYIRWVENKEEVDVAKIQGTSDMKRIKDLKDNPLLLFVLSLIHILTNSDGDEMTQKEVADLLGISQSYISRLEKKIMKRLKKEIVRFE